MSMGLASASLYVASLGTALMLSSGRPAQAQELKNPRLQRSLQMVETARADLEIAERQSPPELREEAHRMGTEVDAAGHELAETLASMGTRRQIEPGRADATNRPIHAAANAMRRALEELTRGVADQDIRGRIRAAADHERAAIEHADRLAHREEALMAAPPPPPVVVEMRHPHLQHAAQMLELARAQLDVAEHRSAPELRDAAHDSIHDIDDATHELAEAFASVGSARSIGVAPVEPTDRPIAAARDALRRAIEELAGAGGEEYHGHARLAADRAHAALDRLEGLSRHEQAMLAPRPVGVELGLAHLQISVQSVEVAQARLDDAQRHLPRHLRERTAHAMRSVDDAIRELTEFLAAVGTSRTI